MALFQGCGVAMITPMNEDGINFDALGQLTDHLIRGGIDALFACGTTGEPSTMSESERLSVIEFVQNRANGRVPVFAGSGGNNTAEAISFSKKCEQLGVDGLLVVTPYYNKCTQNGAVAHYAAISDAVNIPIVAYNVPGRTGLNLLPATVQKLADVKNVRAIKEAGGDVTQMLDVARLTRGKLDLYSGDDSLTLPAVCLGAQGVISVAANVVPHEMSRMTALALKGDMVAAREILFRLSPLMKALFCEVNPIPCKKALQLIGIEVGIPRLPLTELEPQHTELLKDELKKLGLIG